MRSHPGAEHPAAVFANTTLLMAATLAFLTALAAPVLSQTRPMAPADRVNAERANQQEMTKREIKLRNLGEPVAKTSDPKRLQALMDQLEEDFKRILTLHNEIARATTGDKRLDYQFVSDATAEIRKRASRLQSTLALKKEGVDQNQEKRIKFSDPQMKDALILLCKHIESFVTNPVIETPGTVDILQSARADSDLGSIVELSGSIKKSAERLSKSSK